jgi:hypothetical protein
LKIRKTVGELLWPNPGEFVASLLVSKESASAQLLELVWRGYDLLAKELATIDFSAHFDDLERELTQMLEKRIHDVTSGFEPFVIQHGPYERETRRPAPAQPPQYDLAFILRANERVMWPLEAKVLPRALAEYVEDVHKEFLTCRYGPFSMEGGMLGYVVSGNAEDFLGKIAARIPAVLAHHPAFPTRPLRVSNHNRTVPPAKSYPVAFRIHHLMLVFAPPGTHIGSQGDLKSTPRDHA